MSSSFSPIDAATISALNAGQETALEQIFRSNYSWLVQKAAEYLKGENSAVAKLVTTTMDYLWEERDDVHSSQAIESFLAEGMRARARALRARISAERRFEKADPAAAPAQTPAADVLWAEIVVEIRKPPVTRAAISKARREAVSHEVAENITTVTDRAKWRTPFIIVAVAALVSLVTFYVVGQKSRESVINELLGSAEAQNVTTRAGQVGDVTLAENSTVKVAPESRLAIVPRFGTEYRTLTLAGAALFTVAPGVGQPFEARLGDITVQSTGGQFTVRDYADEPSVFVKSIEGTVDVRAGSESRRLAAGEAIMIGRDGAIATPTSEQAAQAGGWTEGSLVLMSVSLGEAASSLWRWYGLDASVADSAAAERVVSITAPLTSSQAAITAVETAGGVKFAWVNGRMVFQVPARRGR